MHAVLATTTERITDDVAAGKEFGIKVNMGKTNVVKIRPEGKENNNNNKKIQTIQLLILADKNRIIRKCM